MRRRRQLEVVAGRVAADGSVVAGTGFTSTRFAVGQYRIYFEAGFRVIVVLPVSTFRYDPGATYVYGSNYVEVAQSSSAGAGTLEDNPFAFVAYGTYP